MPKKETAPNINVVPDEVVINKIYVFREQKVMLDSDLAELYGVETKQLKRQVRRNIDRFPEDFMFELSKGISNLKEPNWHLKTWRTYKVPPNGFYRTWGTDVIKHT